MYDIVWRRRTSREAVLPLLFWDEGAGDGRGDGAVRRGSRDDGTLAIGIVFVSFDYYQRD